MQCCLLEQILCYAMLMHRFSKQRNAIAKSSKAWKYKLIALQAYGAACVCCGETEPAFLTFDHIGGGGEQHRKADPLARKNIALWLIKHSFPEGFRLLCYNCVPLTAQALTKEGWKGPDKLHVGELILAYDSFQDMCLWSPVRNIFRYDNALLLEFKSQSFAVRSTLDHKWFVTTQKGKRSLRASSLLTTSDSILISALAKDGISSVSPKEAAILGYLITDGTLLLNPLQGVIYQSKPSVSEKIRSLLVGISTESIDKRQTGEINGITFERTWLGHRWTIYHNPLRKILENANYTGPESLIGLVTNLTHDARSAMLEAMVNAEGSNRSNFTQNFSSPILTVFRILATLEGRRLGTTSINHGVAHVSMLRRGSGRQAGVHSMEKTLLPPESVWCPQTDFGTWVMQDGNQITITGNCHKAIDTGPRHLNGICPHQSHS